VTLSTANYRGGACGGALPRNPARVGWQRCRSDHDARSRAVPVLHPRISLIIHANVVGH